MNRIKKGDRVKVIAGKERGKDGKVIIPREYRQAEPVFPMKT